MSMRRGFTLIEMMIALSISAVVMSAVFVSLYAVWSLAKESSDELQGALQARSIRERLYYNVKEDGEARYGLISATNIYVTSSKLTAKFPNGSTFSVKAKKAPYYLAGKSCAETNTLQRIYLSFKPSANVTYYDRIVVPVFGRKPTSAEIVNCFKTN